MLWLRRCLPVLSSLLTLLSLADGDESTCDPHLTDSPLASYVRNITGTPHYKDYAGSYFQGIGSYNMTFQTPNSGEFGPSCPSASRRILAVAWVGPQLPNITGLTNPFILNFDSLLSEEPLSDIYRIPCSSLKDPLYPVSLHTTHMFAVSITAPPSLNDAPVQFKDTASLKVWPDPQDPSRVAFNATYSGSDPDPGFFDVYGKDFVHIPADVCSDEIKLTYEEDKAKLPVSTFVIGSITNTTLHLEISGNFTTGWLYETGADPIIVNFDCTFDGDLDRVNSSQIPSIRQPGQPVLSFERFSGSHHLTSPTLLLLTVVVGSVSITWLS